MSEIPYRHVDEIAPARSEPVPAAIAAALERRDWQGVAERVAGLGRELSAPADAAIAATTLESIVRAVAANRRALLPMRAVVPGLERTIKDPWRTGPALVDELALIASLGETAVVSVRVDPVAVRDVPHRRAAGEGRDLS